ncbi:MULTISPECIES: hypothetical protein [unclassified Brevundimonas]|uniref:hypothetical protein n=1 Tax=unclassified Brevundimonas TaxID=2622653 RepID=UPI0025C128EC|nr:MULTISPECIES: hypothetical protein [unclassified Brevundimonas]
MTPELFRELVAEAVLSPNVHNIQPTLWRLVDAQTIALVQSPVRSLPVGDPTRRDAQASHGAAAEGMVIAASARGIALSVATAAPGEVARMTVTGACAPDPLVPFLTRRRTYRGAFDKALEASALKALETWSHPDTRLITDDAHIRQIALLTDQATLRAFRNRPYRQELASWMRLTKADRNWSRDGLNAQAMGMSAPLAVAAGVVLSHPVFEIFDRLQLAGMLTAEAGVTRSASALVAFVQDRDADPFQTGRDWHRLWLELTARGLSAAPLTILGDDAQAAAEMGHRLNLAPHQRLVTVLRAGMVDAVKLPSPARLPVDELILP